MKIEIVIHMENRDIKMVVECASKAAAHEALIIGARENRDVNFGDQWISPFILCRCAFELSEVE